MVTGGAVVGAVAGAAIGLIFLLMPGPKEVTVQPQFPGAVIVLPALMLALAGGLGGAAFGTLLIFAERGRGVESLRIHRVAMWAALATAPAVRLVGWSWTTVALGSVASAALGAAATWVARRGAHVERISTGQSTHV
jgi:hypothetical protein